MLKREPIDCNPKIILNEDKTNFYDFSQDDIYLEDYPKKLIRKKNPQLKFDLGIWFFVKKDLHFVYKHKCFCYNLYV